MSQEPRVTSKSDSGRHDGGSGLASADLDSSDLDNSDPSLVLRTVGLSKSFYLHERRLSVPAFDDVSLSVRCGRFTAVTGPSGSGKSSLLSCIYRTYLPTAGAAFYFPTSGEACDLACVPDEKILQLRSSELSFVTQFLHFLPRKSALEVVARPLLDRSVNQTEAEAAASRVLERVNLPPRLWGISPATFSGGEKQRVNIARGLVRRPRLLLLDEPTASLDAVSKRYVIELIEDAKKEGCAILGVFHDPELVERLADDHFRLGAVNMEPEAARLGVDR